MRPLYQITVNGRVISGTGDPRLVEMTVSDEVGINSDTFALALDDSDGVLELPRRGVLLNVKIGLKELVDMGSYYVDSVQASGPPSVLIVGGKAASYVKNQSMQTRKSASYEGVTLKGLAERIAGKYGMKVTACEEANETVYDHLDQVNESDLGFLNRVAQSVGFIVKPCQGGIMIDRRFSGMTVAGRALESHVIRREEVSQYLFHASDKESYGSIVAEYRVVDGGGTRELVIGSGEPELILPQVYASKEKAKKAAETKLKNIMSSLGMHAEFSMNGDPALFAGLPVLLTGFRDGVDGLYFIQKVVHRIGRSGFTSTVTALESYEEGNEPPAVSKGDGEEDYEDNWDDDDE